MFLLRAFVIHLLLLGSIFVIYFRSPVIIGLDSQNDIPLDAPAKRLVLIITDGLRAESFFKGNCSDVPEISKIMIRKGGVFGISHTRVPTESRPGHIAVIAGLYEDPSAVTRGWKENPVDFDSLFNRSSYTYAWGAKDVLHIFSRRKNTKSSLFIDAYDEEIDFSGRYKTYKLDEWVFQRVEKFLSEESSDIRDKGKVIFFLHLLGLDSAGHIHKPGSELFLENLHRTDIGITSIFESFERAFPDNLTSYILTSDHGMTNAGSHGAGASFETETPFLLWGAGVTKSQTLSGKMFQVGNDTYLPLNEIEQAQLSPLMAALLGLPPPMNNYGILPFEFLNASNQYLAQAMYSNAKQLLLQYQRLLKEHNLGIFSKFLRSYKEIEVEGIDQYENQTGSFFRSKKYHESIETSKEIMYKVLKGIDYYQGYYCNTLLICTSATFVIWITYLLNMLMEADNIIPLSPSNNKSHRYLLMYIFVGLTFLLLMKLQNVPDIIAFYIIMPLLVWIFLIPKRLKFFIPSVKVIMGIILFSELLLFSFFNRKLISLLFSFYYFYINYDLPRKNKFVILKRFVLFLIVVVFPLLPQSIGYQNMLLVLSGLLAALIKHVFYESCFTIREKLFPVAAAVNAIVCFYQHSNQIGIHYISHLISWVFLAYSLISIMSYPFGGPRERLRFILFNLLTLYAMLSTSFESIFILLLTIQLELSTPKDDIEFSNQYNLISLENSLKYACMIMLYTYFSFFGTGNIASISSFDPNIVRCFLKSFSPFTITGFVILKLVIPIILIMSILYGNSAYMRKKEKQIFIFVLLLCDIMGLHFLFLVRNQGSWLDIGSSISHFVIAHVTTLVLLFLSYIAKIFLQLENFMPPFLRKNHTKDI